MTSVRGLLGIGLFLAGCGGGVDAVEDGDGTISSTGGEDGPGGTGSEGTGGDTGSGGAPGATAGSGATSGSGASTSSGAGVGGGAIGCAPEEGLEVVACGLPPDVAVFGADETAAYVLAVGQSGTSRAYRVDLATGAKVELYHDDFSGWAVGDRVRNYLLLDGQPYAVLNRVVGGGVDTGIFRLDQGGLTPIVPFGVTGYTRLVGADGHIYFEGGQGISGLFSVAVDGGQPQTWIEHEGCDSCVLSGGLIGAIPDGEPEVVGIYVAGGELYRIPSTGTALGQVADTFARHATVSPLFPGDAYIPVDAGFLGMHRIERIPTFVGETSTLVEIPDVEGYGAPRFLHARAVGERTEIFYVQTNDRDGGIGRVDGETGEALALPAAALWGQGPLQTSGEWMYFTRVRGGEDGPIEGVVLRARLD